MRIIYSAVFAFVVATTLAHGALASPLSTPDMPTEQYYSAVADIQMTVSNPYGFANLRQKPTTTSKILDRLTQGTMVTVIETVSGGKWAHVKVNGKDGYIETKLLK